MLLLKLITEIESKAYQGTQNLLNKINLELLKEYWGYTLWGNTAINSHRHRHIYILQGVSSSTCLLACNYKYKGINSNSITRDLLNYAKIQLKDAIIVHCHTRQKKNTLKWEARVIHCHNHFKITYKWTLLYPLLFCYATLMLQLLYKIRGTAYSDVVIAFHTYVKIYSETLSFGLLALNIVSTESIKHLTTCENIHYNKLDITTLR